MPTKIQYAPFDKPTKYLRWLSLVYIVLLIIEGALRKWTLPGLSDILLLVRDPVVLLAYGIALVHGKFPYNRYVISGLVIMIVWIFVTFYWGHENYIVTGFGFRVNYMHFPFAFIMGSVLYRSDIVWIGKWWLWGTVGMTALIILQFYSPQSAWINRAPGGMEGAGFSGALGKFRPPGSFSFIIGVVWFYTFSMAFWVAGLTQHKRYSKLLLIVSGVAIVLAIPVSISRTLFLSVLITFATGMFVSTFQKGALIRYIQIVLFFCFGLLIASQISVFDEAKEAFLRRWELSTSESQGGVKGAIIDRTLYEFTGPFIEDNDLPFLGVGLGAGTQVASILLTGERDFTLGESEWFRLTGEGGPIIGGLYIAWRVWIAVVLFKYAFLSYRKGNGIGLILLSATIYNLLIGQIGQTTILGFIAIGIGMTIASLRPRPILTTEQPDDSKTADA